jgi:hypothetical protein
MVIETKTETKTEEKPVKRFRVRMLRGYFPADPAHPRHSVSGDAIKVLRGEEIDLPIDEARAAIKNGIAERADAMPI